MNMNTNILKLLMVIFVSIIVGALPFIFPQALPLNLTQHILLVIFTFAAMCWLTEPIPVYATSLVIMSSLCILISDSAVGPLKDYLSDSGAKLLSFKSILNSFSSPVIILFLGGFALAIGATKYKLDSNLARILLKPFGSKPSFVMLGIMIVTAGFGMFMSNTATTVMMLAMITPVIALIDKSDPGIKAFVLSVPFAANIGGIATPIGTPPNAIALGFLKSEETLSFMEWMAYGFPLAVVCVFVSWFVLCFMFRFKEKKINLNIEGSFSKDWQSIVCYVGFAATILLWMTEKLHGINSYVIALIPLLVFTCTGIIKASDIKNMSWDVIWLVAGGIALGDALSQTGLASVLANIVDYSQYSNISLVLILCFIGWLASNFISNTATANLMIPIAIAVLESDSVHLGAGFEKPMIIMILAFTLSFGMSLPISTPPNALAYASGHIKNSDMLKSGGLISILCFLIAIGFMYIYSVFAS